MPSADPELNAVTNFQQTFYLLSPGLTFTGSLNIQLMNKYQEKNSRSLFFSHLNYIHGIEILKIINRLIFLLTGNLS